MNLSYGLTHQNMDAIVNAAARYPEIERLVLFGSRAKGNFRKGSDVDLALFGEKVTFETVRGLSMLLNEETMMPYRFDVLDFKTIENENLKEHIERVGKVLYDKEKVF